MTRWPILSGAAFAALFAVAAGLYGGGAGSDPGGIRSYYADAGRRWHQQAGFAVLLLGCLFLLVYAAVLPTRLGLTAPAGTVVAASGAASATLLMAGNALWAATAFAAQLDGSAAVSPAGHLLVEDTAFVLVTAAAAAAIPLVALVTVSAVRHGQLPRWFGLLGGLAVLGLAGAYWYLPLLAFPAWCATGSVLLHTGAGTR